MIDFFKEFNEYEKQLLKMLEKNCKWMKQVEKKHGGKTRAQLRKELRETREKIDKLGISCNQILEKMKAEDDFICRSILQIDFEADAYKIYKLHRKKFFLLAAIDQLRAAAREARKNKVEEE
ncbi:MAG: hypothetical protein MJZ83_05290 [Bacteroidaceae bacterium]|nr:hypothetical protein [Bacteroidaceae bacterium]